MTKGKKAAVVTIRPAVQSDPPVFAAPKRSFMDGIAFAVAFLEARADDVNPGPGVDVTGLRKLAEWLKAAGEAAQ